MITEEQEPGEMIRNPERGPMPLSAKTWNILVKKRIDNIELYFFILTNQ